MRQCTTQNIFGLRQKGEPLRRQQNMKNNLILWYFSRFLLRLVNIWFIKAPHILSNHFPQQNKNFLYKSIPSFLSSRQRQNLKIIPDKSFIMAAKAESPYPPFYPSKRRVEKRGRLIRLQRPMEKEALQIAF
jgi:hypothetical protein